MQIPEEFGEDWMDTSDDGNVLVYNFHRAALFLNLEIEIVLLILLF